MTGMRRSRRQTAAAALRAGRKPAFALAALFAVFLQAFVVQAHFHAPNGALGLTIEHAAGADASTEAQVSALDEHQVTGCIICQTLAGGSTGILAAPVTSLVAGPARNDAATFVLPRAPPIAAHPWQSRAPPLSLQA
jgi:hypothetical protein